MYEMGHSCPIGGPALLSTTPIHTVKAEFFRVLGHPVRVRMLELLRDGEKTVGELRELIDIDSSSASQHLAALRRLGLVEATKEGTSVRYAVRDPLIFDLLEVARRIILTSLTETKALLDELSLSEPPGTNPGAGTGSGPGTGSGA
jgi:DNA-binding transcriptional ArsR family regulator